MGTLGGVTSSTRSAAARLADLAAVLCFEQEEAAQPVTESLLDHWAGRNGEPTDVRDAAARLLRVSAASALDTAGALEGVLDQLVDEHERTVFVAWSLAIVRPPLAELATGFGVSAARVGQIRDRAEARVRAASPGRHPLPWIVRSLRARLGSLSTTGSTATVLSDHGIAPGSTAARLALWLAGPFLAVPNRPEWTATDPRAVGDRTVSVLAGDGGIRRLADVTTELGDLGVAAHQVGPWVAAWGAAVVGDLVVSLRGSVADACERVLDASGTVLSVDNVAAVLAGSGRNVPADDVARSLRSRRFRRTGDQVALATWPLPSAETPKATKPATKKSTIRQPVRDVGARADGPSWLWVRVDAAVLAGEEAEVPPALVDGVGVARLRRRSFSSRYGPVTLSHDGPSPRRGSVRAIALAAGATIGDTLLLGFSAAGSVDVEVRHSLEPGLAPVPLQPDLSAPDISEGAR